MKTTEIFSVRVCHVHISIQFHVFVLPHSAYYIATVFSAPYRRHCAIFRKSFNGNEDIHKPKTHCTRHYIQTEQNKATTKKATLSDTILSPSSMPSNWREYPRHFALECLSIEFERANEDKRENVVLESHNVTIELCASIKTG